MKRILAAPLSCFPAIALAHPGHGEPAFHLHSEWAALGLVVIVVALVVWHYLRK